MLNYLWAGMMMLGIIYAAFTGHMPDITNAALDSSKEAITLCITMIGIMSFWVGLMEIATKAGIIEQLSRKLKPLIHFLFPNLPDNHPAATHITTNIIANILGLGCDPVAGLVEVPCVKRNVGGAVNALAAADMALAGIASHIPVDQVIDAMGEVGMKMDVSLRETSMGGVATSPKGLEIAERLGM